MSVLTTSSSYESKEEDVLLLLFFSIFLGILFTYLISRYCTELPYTVAVFCAGVIFALSFQTVSDEDLFKISVVAWEGFNGDLILYTFLPALLFAHSSALNFHRVKENLISAMLLAFPGGVSFAISTAVFAKYVFPYHWDWNLSFLFGAMTCASDPIAILGLLNSVGASLDMTYLILLESLLSDGTALILYELFYELVKDHHGHHSSENTLHVTDVVIYFVKVITLSPLVGIAVSFASILVIGLANMRSKAADTTIQLATTFCCAYFSFYIAQRVLRVSGVIACCTTGILLSRYATPRYVKAETIESVWHAMEWLGNTILFYLAGLIIGNYALSKVVGEDVLYVFIVYLFFVGMRYLVLFILYPALYKAGKGCTTVPEAAFMGWSGMKGASSIALSVAFYQSTHNGETTVSIRNADRLIFLVGGVVALTLLINATASKLILLRLHLLEEEAPVTKGTLSKRGKGDQSSNLTDQQTIIRKQLSMKKETKVMYEYLQKKIRLKAYNLLEQLIPMTDPDEADLEEEEENQYTLRNAFMSGKSTSTVLARYLDVDFIFRHCTLLRESPEASAFLRNGNNSNNYAAEDDSYFQTNTEEKTTNDLPVNNMPLNSHLLAENQKSMKFTSTKEKKKKDKAEELENEEEDDIASVQNSSTKEDISVTDYQYLQKEIAVLQREESIDNESLDEKERVEEGEGRHSSDPSSSQKGSRKIGSIASGSRKSHNPYQLKENELNEEEDEEGKDRQRLRSGGLLEEEEEEGEGGGYYVENLSTKENISKIDYEAIQLEMEKMKREEEARTSLSAARRNPASVGSRTAPSSVKLPRRVEKTHAGRTDDESIISVQKAHSSASLNQELLKILKDSVSVNHRSGALIKEGGEEDNTIRVKKSLSSASLENRRKKAVKVQSPRLMLEPLPAVLSQVEKSHASIPASQGSSELVTTAITIPPPPATISLPPSIIPPSNTIITKLDEDQGSKPPKKEKTVSSSTNLSPRNPSKATPRSPTEEIKYRKHSIDESHHPHHSHRHSSSHRQQHHPPHHQHHHTPRTPQTGGSSFESLIADKLQKLQHLRHCATQRAKQGRDKKEPQVNRDLGDEVEEEVMDRLSVCEEGEEDGEGEGEEWLYSNKAVHGLESVRHPETPRGSPTSEIEGIDENHHSSLLLPSKDFSSADEPLADPTSQYLHASYSRMSFPVPPPVDSSKSPASRVEDDDVEDSEYEVDDEEEDYEATDTSNYVTKRLSFRMLHNIIYDNLLITMRKVFLEVLRVNYFKQINSEKLPRKSLAAILLLNSIDISFHRIQSGVEQSLQDFDILIENHHYLQKLSQGRQISELERYHHYHHQQQQQQRQEKAGAVEKVSVEDSPETLYESFDPTRQQPLPSQRALHHQLHHHYAYSIHLHTVVILLISLIEAHEFAQSRIAFYLHEGGNGEEEGGGRSGHIDTPEQDLVITESKKQVLRAKQLLLMIDEPMITYIYSKRILFSILSLEQSVVEDYQKEGVIATKYADLFYQQIEADIEQLTRLERSKLLYHQQYSMWALSHYVTEYYFEEWINVFYNWKDSFYETFRKEN